MSGDADKSAGISRRRALAEEIFEGRFRAVATTPVEDRDPGFNSPLWPLGAGRLAAGAAQGPLEERRAAARDLGVLALAWLEAIDRELPAERGAGGEQDPAGDLA